MTLEEEVDSLRWPEWRAMASSLTAAGHMLYSETLICAESAAAALLELRLRNPQCESISEPIRTGRRISEWESDEKRAWRLKRDLQRELSSGAYAKKAKV